MNAAEAKTGGVEDLRRVFRIGLLGAPNTGKSSIFNRLTGLRQRTANYPGITVEKKVGPMEIRDDRYEVIDFPGAYSLSASSPDERVTVDALCGDDPESVPDLVVCVLDATRLSQGLFLPMQVADFEVPQVIVLNQWDVAEREGVLIDCGGLSRRLGVPVIPVSAVTGRGISELKEAIAGAMDHPAKVPPMEWPPVVEEGLTHLAKMAPDLDRGRLLRIFFDCRSAVLAKVEARYPGLGKARCEAREMLRTAGYNPGPAEAVIRHETIREHLAGVLADRDEIAQRPGESIDRVLMHPFWGMTVFIGVMYVLFQSVYSWAGPVMDGIEWMTGAAQAWVAPFLAGMPMFQSLMVDGILGGVGGVVVFLPQIFILFLFVGLLEESGYMARAAFIMDRTMGWCGLNGKSFVPLLSSYACAIPGIMSARTLEEPRARISTIMMAPFMSCSARLPVYVLLIGAFIEPVYGAVVAGWALFLAHFIGMAVAVVIAWLANRVFTKQEPIPFILEMPAYRVPNSRNIFLRMWTSGREFLIRAGTVILAFSVIIWGLLYFPRGEEAMAAAEQAFVAEMAMAEGISETAAEARIAENPELAGSLEAVLAGAQMEQSYLGRMGHAVQPIFAPAGFDWKITAGVISSFPAREVIIATLGIIYNLGPDEDEESAGLRERLAGEVWQSGERAGMPIYTLPTVLAIIVFFALCHQCGASVAAIVKEIGWRWAALSFFGMSLIAWVAAVAVYQLGSLL